VIKVGAARDHDKAIELLKQAVAKSPRNASAHYHLGEAYGDAAQSAGIFSQASLAAIAAMPWAMSGSAGSAANAVRTRTSDTTAAVIGRNI
jgi:tetratricopeptide (TPR) repeat protein